MKKRLLLTAAPMVFAGLLASGPAGAAGVNSNPAAPNANAGANAPARSDAKDARNLVNDAVGVVQKMKSDPHMTQLLKQAKGIFIVPHYGRGAFVVGGRGGEGVLLEHKDGHWSNPAFYNLGGISVGLQAGGEGGAIAMLLHTDKAVNAFKGDNTFSLNAEAGLTVINYSARGQASWGKGDVMMWTNTKGLFGGASVSASDISYDENAAHGYYGKKVNAQEILSGRVSNPQANKLQEVLPA